MSSVFRILKILSDGKFHSGASLGNELGVTRTAIWKATRKLTDFGLDIHAIRGKGYRLSVPVELLDHDSITRKISNHAGRQVRQFEIFDVIDSTNQYLLEKSGTADIHGHVVLAEYQTRGRGRRGNSWVSPPGAGINLSVAWRFDQSPESAGVLSLVAGVAIIRVLKKAGVRDVGLKWPNDILWNGSKLGGILLEMRGEASGPFDVVFGIGINTSFPGTKIAGIDQPWSDVARITRSIPSRNGLVADLVSELFLVLDQFLRKGVRDVLNEWRQYDCIQGKQANLMLSDKQIWGKVIGIDDRGALLMSVRGEMRRFNAGEIRLRVVS